MEAAIDTFGEDLLLAPPQWPPGGEVRLNGVVYRPGKQFHESDLTNNVALRKVILSGKAGARTVSVPPHDLTNTP
jgi:hypothetical protein